MKKPGHENLDLLKSNGPHCPLVAALRYSEQIIPLSVGTGRGHTSYRRRIRTRTHHADHRFEKFLPRNVHPRHFYGARIPRRTWSQEVFHDGPGVVPQWPADLKMARMTKYKAKLTTERRSWNPSILFYILAPQQQHPCSDQNKAALPGSDHNAAKC